MTDLSLFSLLGEPPSSRLISHLVSDLASSSSPSSSSPSSSFSTEPLEKRYRDVVYHNYYSLGLSISFEPRRPLGGSTEVIIPALPLPLPPVTCASIDVYNLEQPSRREDDQGPSAPSTTTTSRKSRSTPVPEYSPFRRYPISLPVPRSSRGQGNNDDNDGTFALYPTTTGKQVVERYGEPGRKGGGETKGMGIWTEWIVPLDPQDDNEDEGDDDERGNEEKERQEDKVGVMLEWKSSGLGAWDKGGDSTWRVLTLFRP
ncbi:hypothetical protein JCM10212_005052 [Sporobolomyces blumeae]